MIELYERYPALSSQRDAIEKAKRIWIDTFETGHKLLLCGNGGSSADCDHITGELLKGFLLKRPLPQAARDALTERLGCDDPDAKRLAGGLQSGLPAVSLPAQSALISAFCNDVDPSLVYAQLTLALGKPGDTLVCISTSGNSENVVLAAKAAASAGIRVVGLTGSRPCKLDALCETVIHVPETETYKVQEYHLPVYHYLCAETEAAFFEA